MTQEEKELLFIDISGRLHYGVIVNYKEDEYDHHKWKITTLHTLNYSKSGTLINTNCDGWISHEEYIGCGMSSNSSPFSFGEVLPYLRPMSSMTEKEREELEHLSEEYFGKALDKQIQESLSSSNRNESEILEYIASSVIVDWLNSNHFDYRGLIKKGLAIEVTEENNPYEN